MQSKIDILQEQLKGRGDDNRNDVNPAVNFDDPQWMLTFMEELKNRTMKGTSNFGISYLRCYA